ncbi:hypothetical protein IV454_25945 [Massilia antarctica]|uniref:Uncharacterized protein n=1 Tax=Massilia antarctica TaxID=2765360 RepID=A0AA49A7L6_9BURK|nr:hypothetical protein [Massilia antarctica]QPI48902.1 hypothetical protein IV454_25945 [Massilia antarctica]
MQQIAQLQAEYFKLRFGYGDGAACVDWAVERLVADDEGDDLEIVLLVCARGREEVLGLVEVIIARYLGADRLDDEVLAGKYIVALRRAYLEGKETVHSLDTELTKLYPALAYPCWLTMLSRNCEYATDVPEFEEPFEQEFKYISELWANAANLAEFERQYRREISNQHDAKYG